MTLRVKIHLAVAAALLVGGAFFVFEHTTGNLLRSHADLLAKIGDLERLDARLDGEVLRASLLLYHNYDDLHRLDQGITALLETIEAGLAPYPEDYGDALDRVAAYRRAMAEKRHAIETYQTLNSAIKNSATYIPSLGKRLIGKLRTPAPEYLRHLSAAVASVSLAKNGMDPDFVEQLRHQLETLEAFPLDGNPVLGRFNAVFINHLRVFLDYFPRYVQGFDAIMEADTRARAGNIRTAIVAASARQSERMTLWSRLLAAAFALAIALIIYFLLRIERENKQLVRLQARLREAATHDRLTGLRNRFGFELDAKDHRDPALWLVNIDGFKHINNFYGTGAGDQVLNRMAETLRGITADLPNTRVYRLGGDDFGIVREALAESGLADFGAGLLRALDDLRVSYLGNEISVAVTVSASRTAPLLETADMALKSLKGARDRFRIYRPDLEIYRRIEGNLAILETIKDALRRDAVVPYFQPICNNHTGRIEKYECLVRILGRDGGVLQPGSFLAIAKQSRLYADITRVMIDKCFAAFADSDLDFSINLSVEDIADPHIRRLILERLQAHPETGQRVIFEILESEDIDNYDLVIRFIHEVKAFGCKIAIDDFGAGYSNLEHLLHLDVDFVKLDASLIKDLDTDANAQTLVRTIVDFSKKIQVRCITAEHVHSVAVLDKVREIGVDYAQGYFIGKPQAHFDQAPK